MRIDVYHDTACPWCRIGKAHLQQALALWTGEPPQVHYHAFFLNPFIPAEGYPFQAYMHAKGGGRALEQWFAAPRQMGQQVGIVFNFEKIAHAPNTLLSHCLIAAAPEAQREALLDAVYAAYFEHGQNIGDLETLLAVAAAHHLDTAALRQQITDPGVQQAVAADAQAAQALGVTGVPFFVFNQRLAFSGAQPPAVILLAMQQAAAQRTIQSE